MSRPLRIEYEDAYYHVMNRGRGRQKIFHGEDYYNAFLDTLNEAHERFGLQIHAYCLMGNHYHLLVKTPEGELQRAMRHIGGVYTQRYNRLKRTDGALFRGRYKAILIDDDEYLLHVSKYIHRNPLEAKLVRQLERYLWSSYPCYLNKQPAPDWLHRQEVYGQLHSKRNVAQKYAEYVMDDVVNETVKAFYGRDQLGTILGDELFVEAIQNEFEEVSEEVARRERNPLRPEIKAIVRAVSEYYGLSEQAIYAVKKGRGVKNEPRKLAMYLAQCIGDYRLTEIAEQFGLRHYGGVSNAIHMIKQALEEDKKLKHAKYSIINRFDP